MEFRCRLGTAEGEVIEGIYVAESEAQLRHELDKKGLLVFAMAPRRGVIRRLALPARRRISHREFIIFNQELATLLKAGLPLVQSLDILRQRMVNEVFKSVLDDLHERVRSGIVLSDAFALHGDLFPRVYTASLVAGEKSGNLEQVLRRYVAYAKVLGAVRRRTLSALIYPAVLVALALTVISIIVLRVVPAFSDFYATFEADLPLATRTIVGVSLAMRRYGLLAMVLIAVAVAASWAWIRKPAQRARVDRLILRLPWVGPTVRKYGVAQLGRTLATLLGGGIPLVNAIEVSARSVSNQHLAQELHVVGQRVREGESFASALAARAIVPDVALKMIEVGESTGALQEMLNSLADFFDEELETDLGRFVTLVEPLLLVIMGIVIAALLLSLYLPLIQLSSVVSS